MFSVTTISFDIFELEIWVTLISGMKLVIASEEEQHNMKLLIIITILIMLFLLMYI